MNQSRTEIITGSEGLEKLHTASVAVFGLGGVGGYALEALARAGIGTLHIYDFDTVAASNINRQIIALDSTMGSNKTEAAANRLLLINPDLKLHVHQVRLTPENIPDIFSSDFQYAVDAIDDIPAKIELLVQLTEKKKTFISSMGAGNRLDPSKILIDNLSKTSYCPLAKKVRKGLKARQVYKGVPVVYSTEEPVRKKTHEGGGPVGSISYLPGIFGLTAAGYIIRRILGKIN